MREINIERAAHLIDGIIEHAAAANGHEKVLFIGSTGAGKSTLLNYLNGTRYEPYRRMFMLNVRPLAGVPEVAKTGVDSTQSQTLYPQVFRKTGADYVYCDLAGLFDSHGREEQVCAAISTMLLSKSEGHIKGIVIVLDAPGFYSEKGRSFKKTARALALLTKGSPELMDSVCFVITKVPVSEQAKVTNDDIMEIHIDPLIGLLNDTVDEAELELLSMLKAIKHRKKNLLIANVCDNGASRHDIEMLIQNLPAKNASLFNFSNFDDAQIAFNSTLLEIANGFLAKKLKIEGAIPERIRELQTLHATITAKINENRNAVDAINIEIGLQEKLDVIVSNWVKAMAADSPATTTQVAESNRLLKESALLLEDVKSCMQLDLPAKIGWLPIIVGTNSVERVELLKTELSNRRWCLPWNANGDGRDAGPAVLLQRTIDKLQDVIRQGEQKCLEISVAEAECEQAIEDICQDIEDIKDIYRVAFKLIDVLGYKYGDYLSFQQGFSAYINNQEHNRHNTPGMRPGI